MSAAGTPPMTNSQIDTREWNGRTTDICSLNSITPGSEPLPQSVERAVKVRTTDANDCFLMNSFTCYELKDDLDPRKVALQRMFESAMQILEERTLECRIRSIIETAIVDLIETDNEESTEKK